MNLRPQAVQIASRGICPSGVIMRMARSVMPTVSHMQMAAALWKSKLNHYRRWGKIFHIPQPNPVIEYCNASDG